MLCYVAGTLKQCDLVPVKREVSIPWKPDSENITVTTDSVAGSREDVVVTFYDKDGNQAGGVWIGFYTQLRYNIGSCTIWTPFPVKLPTATQKTWTITYNYTEQRVVYYCNEVQVVLGLVLAILANSYLKILFSQTSGLTPPPLNYLMKIEKFPDWENNPHLQERGRRTT